MFCAGVADKLAVREFRWENSNDGSGAGNDGIERGEF
jgi:hypothetical protein